MRAKNLLIGMAAVFAAGTIAGALIAPDKGARTRRRLGRRYRMLVHRTEDDIAEGRDLLEQLKDDVMEQLEIIDEKIEQLSCR